MLCALALIAVAPSHALGHAIDHLKSKDDIGINKIPNVGTSRILVIPMRVGDAAFPPARLEALRRFFATEGGPGTFRRHWQVVSGGRYDPIPTVVEPVLYPECPLPGRDVAGCTVSVQDIELLSSRAIQATFESLLARVRDEQRVDLGEFDKNGKEAGAPDGFLDGVVVDTDIYQGIAFPLAAFENTAMVATTPGGGGGVVACGIVALVPPNQHEFGHLFGFMDLYRGPTTSCLMSEEQGTLSAFSRQQIGWGEVREVRHATELELAPVLAGGPVLRIGAPPRYVLVENRGGPLHAELETAPAGVYAYSVDEDELPFGPLGFLDFEKNDLYLPNLEPPYLNVNLPVGCTLYQADAADACVLQREGQARDLVHASGAATGFSLRVGATSADGTVRVTLAGPPAPPPDAGVRPDGPGAPAEQPAAVESAGGCDASGRQPPAGLLALWAMLGIAQVVRTAAQRLRCGISAPASSRRAPRRACP